MLTPIQVPFAPCPLLILPQPAESLALRFQLPETLVPLERARVDVVSAALSVDERGLSVGVTLDVGITRAGDDQASPPLGGTGASPDPS